MSDVSIVVLSWNTRDLLLDCLSSVEREVEDARGKGIATETLVVDNGSSDGTAPAVRARFPWARVIELDRNLGFAGGNNVGLRESRGRIVLFLNSDAMLGHGSLDRCARFLEANPDVGVVGPQLHHLDGSKQNSVHNFPSLTTELVPKGVLQVLFPSRYPSKRFRHRTPVDVDSVRGAAFFVRREVVRSVGPMPDEYFFFLEETDWCWSIRKAGWRVVYLPEAHVIHLSGGSSKRKLPALTRIQYHRSLYRFLRKYRGPGSMAAVVALRVLKEFLYCVALAPAALVSRRQRRRWLERGRVFVWHLQGCPESAGLRQFASQK